MDVAMDYTALGQVGDVPEDEIDVLGMTEFNIDASWILVVKELFEGEAVDECVRDFQFI